MVYVYYCLTSDRKEIVIRSDKALFVNELIEKAGRNDIKIINMGIE